MTNLPLVLLADDDPDDIYLAQSAFRQTSVQLHCKSVHHGQGLLDYLHQAGSEMPDLILMDLNMPVLDGKQTLEALKENARYKGIPVIVFTTSTQDADIEDAYRLGANSYIVKPGSLDELIQVMECVVQYWFKTVRQVDHKTLVSSPRPFEA